MTAAMILFAGCADNSAPVTDSDTGDQEQAAADEATLNTLTPEGWGPLRIGMSLEDVTVAVGGKADPDAMGGPEPEFCEEYQPAQTPEGLYVMIEEGVLTRITLNDSSEVHTAEGLSVGDSADAVRAAYGGRLESMPHTYVTAPGEYLTVWSSGEVTDNGTSDPNARGIRYEIGEDEQVQLIHAGGPSIQYVEGCL